MELPKEIKQLTSQQQKQFKQLIKTLNYDSDIQKLCLQYYQTFKKQMGYISPEKLTIALKCAYFIAQKSQMICTVGGQKVAGYSLSLNQFMQNHKLDDILITLKQFTKKVKVNDQKTEQQLNAVVQQISFLIKMFCKFQSVFKMLQLEQTKSSLNSEYKKTFKSFTWLLYIQTKKQVLKQSLQLIQNTCLLAQTICYVLIISWDHLKSKIFMGEKGLTDQSSWKQILYKIKEKILDKFYIKDMEIFKYIAQSFEQNFNKMINNGVIKGQIVSKGNSKMVDCCSPQIIFSNYQRLDHLYRKSLDYNDLDQRIFIKERPMNLTPSKVTPFAKQGYVNKLAKNQQKDQIFKSCRILNYQQIEQQYQTNSVNKLTNFSNMKIPKNVQQTPSVIKVPLICHTPITNGMQMFNYLNEKTKKFKGKSTDESIEKFLIQIFEKDTRQYDKNSKFHKKQMINSLYLIGLNEFKSRNPKQQISQELKKAFLGISTEIVFFVSNINISFEIIQQVLDLDILLEWKVCDFFLNFDKNIPPVLKLHLLDIEVNIVSIKVWREPYIIKAINSCANEISYSNKSIQKLFRRILHQTAYQIVNICSYFNIEEQASQQIFETVKQILINFTYLLENFHLDQFILCSIFVNFKIRSRSEQKYKIRFSQIINRYEQCNMNNKRIHEQIIYKIDIGQQNPITIVQFYNKVIIPQIKGYFKNRSSQSQILDKQNSKIGVKRRNSVLQSPLRNIIPKQLVQKQLKRNSMNSNGNLNNGKQMTPQTSLLIAYNQSPMLKCDFGAFKVPVNSKKVIDFDQQQQKIMNNYSQIEYHQPQQDINSIQKNGFISKIFNNKKNVGSNFHQMIYNAPITSQGVFSSNILKSNTTHNKY